MQGEINKAPGWMKITLILAGIYNLAWGIITILWPELYFTFSKMATSNYPEIWQCVGMIVGVYGIGYIIAAFDPYKHWPIILVGLLGKIFGPFGFLNAYYKGTFTLAAGLTNITNDLVWWIPFTIILIKAYRFYHPKEIVTNRN
ncbi:MAG: alkyl hydroperoxide reductase [Ignavibacteria bacterium]